MKTAKLLLLLLIMSHNATAQCYSKIVAYSRNYIALQTDGTLWAKGTGYGGFLGFGNTSLVTEFTQIGTDATWTDKISLNGINVFAIKTDGTLWVWGRNFQSGAAGLGTYDDLGYFIPRQIGTDTNWANVAAGYGFTVATKTDGTLWSWGSNSYGQLGIGNIDDLYTTNVPIQIGSETNWSLVFAGNSSTAYAIKTNGTLWSWGNDGNYIGYPNSSINNNYRSPKQIGSDNWKTITLNNFSPMTAGIKTDGSLWGWGSSPNFTYLFGNGIDNYASQTPIRIGNDSDWKDICLSQGTAIGLKNNGTRWGWGRNTNGYELGMGVGFNTVITLPTQSDTDNDWKTLSIDIYEAGYGDGIKQNNALYHWGNTHTNVVYPSPTLFSNITCTLGLDNFESSNTLTVYPNPVSDKATIHLNDKSGQVSIKITNSLGQCLLSEKIEIVNNEVSFNLSQYPKGVYYVTLKVKEYNYKTKIIKN